MLASNRLRRASVVIAAGIVGLLAIAGPVSAIATSERSETAPVSIVTAPASSSVEVTVPVTPSTTEPAPVATTAVPVAASVPAKVKAVSAKASAPATTNAPAAVEIPVEIGTACVIEADGTSTGCE